MGLPFNVFSFPPLPGHFHFHFPSDLSGPLSLGRKGLLVSCFQALLKPLLLLGGLLLRLAHGASFAEVTL